MKKIFTIILTVIFILSVLPCHIFAENGNLLPEKDSTFESGKTAWTSFAGGEVNIVDNPSGEGKVLEYTNGADAKNWASPILDIKKIIQGSVTEECTVYISMDIYSSGKNANLPLLIRTKNAEDFSLCNEAEQNYCTLDDSNRAEFEPEVWKRFELSFTVTEEDLKSKGEYWNLCFNGVYLALNGGEGAIYLDNIYIGSEPAGEDMPTHAEIKEETPSAKIPEKTTVTRGNKTLIGAIRWDAYTKSTPDGKNPSSQVARVLSRSEHHAQVPFFGNIAIDGTVSFPEYTLKTWEKETEYALNAGIDYYAYLWYETTDDMSQPRKLHLESSKKDSIKMVAILETIRSEKTMQELFQAMKDSCYVTLDGRCVLFLYDMPKWDLEKVTKVRQMAADAGIEKALYIVGMDASEKNLSENLKKDIDAISWYGMGSSSAAQPFSELSEKTEAIMTKLGGQAAVQNIGLIPTFTTGRDCSARIKTAVTWIEGDPDAEQDKDKPYKNMWTLQPTMEELDKHITNVYNYVQTNTLATTPNMILGYGWNEHDEGGWLCPTITVDAEGNPVYNEDGTIKANTERLDALKRAIDRVRAGESAPDASATPGASSAPEATPVSGNNTNNGGFNILYVIIPAAIAVVAGAVITIIIIKKKKANKTEE